MLAVNRETIYFEDKVFSTAARARVAMEKYGKDKVTNATIGSLFCEEGKLVVFPEVVNSFKNIDERDIFGYAKGITGDEEFKLAVKKSVLGESFEKDFSNHFTQVISTPGGSGALSNSIKTYLHKGEKILLPNLMWDPYKLMVKSVEGDFETYRLFNEENLFDLKGFQEKVEKLSKVQKSLVIIINDPCQNPTGYKLSLDEWKGIMEILKSVVTIPVILIKDIAYSEFDFITQEEKKEQLNCFKNLPENLLIIFSFSISKSFASYGLRVGAQLALSTNKKIIQDFTDAASFFCRASWSNVSAGGMRMFSEIVLNSEKFERLEKERDQYVLLLRERSYIFLKESDIIGLKYFPYKSGFFITLPLKISPEKVIIELEKENIFTIPLDNSIRIAICSLPKEKIKGLAQKIQNIILATEKNQR